MLYMLGLLKGLLKLNLFSILKQRLLHWHILIFWNMKKRAEIRNTWQVSTRQRSVSWYLLLNHSGTCNCMGCCD